MALKYPLRNLIYERLKVRQNVTDSELLEQLNSDGIDASIRDLNKALLQLEIRGLISVRWVGKDKRRIEILEGAPQAY